MTKEEAIELLDNLIGMVEDNQDNDYDEAFKMGIKALKNQKSIIEELEKIKAEIRASVFGIQATSDKYFDGVDDVMDIVDSILDKHIKENKE